MSLLSDPLPAIGSFVRRPDGSIWKIGAYGWMGGERYVWLHQDSSVLMIPFELFRIETGFP